MADYLLDTNHASTLVTLGHPVRARILRSLEEGHTFATCVPVVAETLFGIGILPRAAANIAEWRRLKSRLPCYVPEETDAEFAADLQLSLRRQGRQLDTSDALIGTIALRYGLTLLTADRDFDPVPGLARENWL